MGCCSPEYRKVTDEKVKEINRNGKDSPPLWVKFIVIFIIAGAVYALFFR